MTEKNITNYRSINNIYQQPGENQIFPHHSCFPNMVVNRHGLLVPRMNYVPGMPPTVDYSTLFIGTQSIGACSCGFNGCRKQIMGFNFLPVRYQIQYLSEDAVPDFIRILFEC